MRWRQIRRWTSGRSRTQKTVDERKLKQHLAHRLTQDVFVKKYKTLILHAKWRAHDWDEQSSVEADWILVLNEGDQCCERADYMLNICLMGRRMNPHAKWRIS
jgi:hypothetical protein